MQARLLDVLVVIVCECKDGFSINTWGIHPRFRLCIQDSIATYVLSSGHLSDCRIELVWSTRTFVVQSRLHCVALSGSVVRFTARILQLLTNLWIHQQIRSSFCSIWASTSWWNIESSQRRRFASPSIMRWNPRRVLGSSLVQAIFLCPTTTMEPVAMPSDQQHSPPPPPPPRFPKSPGFFYVDIWCHLTFRCCLILCTPLDTNRRYSPWPSIQ